MSHKEKIDGIDMEEASEQPGVGQSALLLLRDIGIAVVIIVVALIFVKPTIVFEHSMDDTLHPEDYVFLAKQAYAFGEPESGDIVVFESVSDTLLDENGNAKNLIKRVIGVPGDIIEIKDGAVYRNGVRLDEPYTKEGVTNDIMKAVTVPPDAYFVLGDNRIVSKDSRSAEVGFVSKDRIRGKVVFRLLPFSRFGKIE